MYLLFTMAQTNYVLIKKTAWATVLINLLAVSDFTENKLIKWFTWMYNYYNYFILMVVLDILASLFIIASNISTSLKSLKRFALFC